MHVNSQQKGGIQLVEHKHCTNIAVHDRVDFSGRQRLNAYFELENEESSHGHFTLVSGSIAIEWRGGDVFHTTAAGQATVRVTSCLGIAWLCSF